MADKDYMAVLLEEIRDQNKAVLEAVGDMRKHVALLPNVQSDIAELKQDVRVIKAAISDMSHQLADHEYRITRLEAS
jgi:hypothetical protein